MPNLDPCSKCNECDQCAKLTPVMMWRCEACVFFLCTPRCHYDHAQAGHVVLGGVGAVPVPVQDSPDHECRSKTEARLRRRRCPYGADSVSACRLDAGHAGNHERESKP